MIHHLEFHDLWCVFRTISSIFLHPPSFVSSPTDGTRCAWTDPDPEAMMVPDYAMIGLDAQRGDVGKISTHLSKSLCHIIF